MEHKRGDTFNYVAAIPLSAPDGHFAEFTPLCQIRRKNGDLLATLTTSWVNPTTARLIHLRCEAADTELWPIASALLDVELRRVSDDYVISTKTIELNIVKDITL